MKKSIFIIGIIGILLASCKKNSPQPPVPDSDLTYAKDAVTSYEVTNDVFLMTALTRDTYTATPFFGTIGVTIKKDTIGKTDSLFFNNAKGTDGNIRNGIIVIKYAGSLLNAKFIRQPGFKCSVQLINYVINTTTVSATAFNINNTTPNGFNPNTTKLTWATITSNFTINNGSHSIITSGTQNITLNNTSDPNVYNNTGNLPINWQFANISVTGNINGSNNSGSFDVTFNNPAKDFLYRDFAGCAPEGFLKPGKHPFIKGIIYLKPANKNTQKIDMGNQTCDYNMEVTIDGNTYQTDVL